MICFFLLFHDYLMASVGINNDTEIPRSVCCGGFLHRQCCHLSNPLSLFVKQCIPLFAVEEAT